MLTTSQIGGAAPARTVYPPAMPPRRDDPWARLRAAIRAERKRRGWDQETAARRAKISRPTLSGIERGATTDPTRETIEKIALAFGWQRDDLDGLLSGTRPLEEPVPAAPLPAQALAVARDHLPLAAAAELELYVRKVIERDRLNDEIEQMRQRFGRRAH